MEGGNTAVPVGVWVTGIVLGSCIVTLRVEWGLFPGRPDGEWVDRLVTCQGSRPAWRELAAGAANAEARMAVRRTGFLCILSIEIKVIFTEATVDTVRNKERRMCSMKKALMAEMIDPGGYLHSLI